MYLGGNRVKSILIVLIPGLGSEGLDRNKSDTWPEWVRNTYFQLVAGIPGAIIVVENYINPNLPEHIISVKTVNGCDSVVIVGHSDGGATATWISSHVARLGESLIIDLMVLLDNVTDLWRHGWIRPLDPQVVMRCIRIYQSADPLIHSNAVQFAGDARKVEDMPTAGPPFNHPSDDHVGLAEDPAVQAFIVQQVSTLASASPMVGLSAVKCKNPMDRFLRQLLVPLVEEIVNERMGKFMTQINQLDTAIAANKAETATLLTSVSNAIGSVTSAVAALTAKIAAGAVPSDLTREIADVTASTDAATKAQQSLDTFVATLAPSSNGTLTP